MIEILLWVYASGSVLFLAWHIYQLRTNWFYEPNIAGVFAWVLVWPVLLVVFFVMALWEAFRK